MEVGMMMHSSSFSSPPPPPSPSPSPSPSSPPSSSQNQKTSPYNNKSSYFGNPKSNSMMMNMNNQHQQPLISRRTENLFPSNNNSKIHKGLLQTPPNLFLSNSFPPYFPSFPHPPPPLVHAPSLNYSNNNNNPAPLLARGLSCPPPIKGKHNNNNRRTREQSLTPKKSKKAAPSNSRKKEDKSENNVINVVGAVTTKASPADSPGSDPKDLTSKVVVSLSPRPSSVRGSIGNKVSVINSMSSSEEGGKYQLEMDVFSGPVVFTPSPPPSSLPLPTFSLRPKLSCNAQASSASATAIDTGATDGLRRLLRLHQ